MRYSPFAEEGRIRNAFHFNGRFFGPFATMLLQKIRFCKFVICIIISTSITSVIFPPIPTSTYMYNYFITTRVINRAA